MVDGPNAPFMESMCYSASHIQERVTEATRLKNQIADHIERLDDQLEIVDLIFAEHLWIDPALMPEITTNIRRAKAHTEDLLDRSKALVNGFEGLSQEDDVIEGELCD